MLYAIEPYRQDKNLGKAYNDQIRHYSSSDWLCLKDIDVLFLTPDTLQHMHQYTELYPDAGVLTCFTNRIGNPMQLLGGKVSENDSIRYHLDLARKQQEKLYQVTELVRPISGFIMLIKKSTWDQLPFAEHMLCLGVDNDYHNRVVAAGKKVLRMDGLYVWHTYRLLNGIKDKSHLMRSSHP